jgi:hypothetical protein
MFSPPSTLAVNIINLFCLNSVLERPMPEPGFEHFPGVSHASRLENKEEDNHPGPTNNP